MSNNLGSHDLGPHLAMWHAFLKLLTYSIVGIAVIVGVVLALV